jgi:hypothetical protein
MFCGRAVLQNSNGEAVAGCYWPLENVLSACTAEAMAMLKGLVLVKQIGCQNVVIESDSCNGTIEIWSPYTAILAECLLMATIEDFFSTLTKGG